MEGQSFFDVSVFCFWKGAAGSERRMHGVSPGVHLKVHPGQLAAVGMMCRGWELTAGLVRVHAMVHVDLPFTLFNPLPQQIPSSNPSHKLSRVWFSCKAGFSSPLYHPASTLIPAEFVFRRWSLEKIWCLNIEQGEWLSELTYSFFSQGFCTLIGNHHLTQRKELVMVGSH